jgi:hypothetical protein
VRPPRRRAWPRSTAARARVGLACLHRTAPLRAPARQAPSPQMLRPAPRRPLPATLPARPQANWRAKLSFPYGLLCDPSKKTLTALGIFQGGKIVRSHIVVAKGGKLIDVRWGARGSTRAAPGAGGGPSSAAWRARAAPRVGLTPTRPPLPCPHPHRYGISPGDSFTEAVKTCEANKQ